ncbi:hypothetical protein [Pantoea eucalypti]|uniref:hypothetical protein n=1 Tax=Pantoea eucalypti TaxID=470933 RepID=UPI00301DAB5F
MKKINLGESNGALLIDGNEIDLSSYSAFTNSSFFKCADDLTPFGKYYFFSKDVLWHNEPFFVEFRPSVFSIKGSVFLTSKTGEFFKNMNDWEKRANLNILKGEESRLFAWVLNRYPSNYKGTIENPPYGDVWSFTWGEITVQSDTNAFECGIYIKWSLI